MSEKANILVLGTSGAGKSTLINTIIGAPVAKVGQGGSVSKEMTSYESEDLNLRLIDSRGFELNMWETYKGIRDMRAWMRDGLKSDKPMIHMLWYCVDATSKRFTKQNIKAMEQVKKEWPGVPIIVVLTKSFFVAEDNDNIEMVKETFLKFAHKTGMPLAIIPVLSEPPKEEGIVSRGIDELLETTEANIDFAVRASEEAIKKYEIKRKKTQAQLTTIGAATSASVVGAIPINFPDALILTPLETTLITAIAKIYDLDNKEDSIKKLVERIIEAGTVGMIAKTAINQLKNIPGWANLAADVINSIVAGVIVLIIGESSAFIMEKIYMGEVDSKDLDWVDKVLEGNLGKSFGKVSDLVTQKGDSVKPKEIIMALFKQETKEEN